jgi:hypothetical protein
VLGSVIALGALTAAAGTPAFGSAGGGSDSTSAAESGGQTIHVIAVFREEAEIDNGAQGFSLGDDVVFSGKLRQGGQRVGTLGVVCTFTSVANLKRVEAQCPATARLPGGQITFQGLVVNRNLRVLPINGGSGQYQGADGEAHARPLSQTRIALTIRLDD